MFVKNAYDTSVTSYQPVYVDNLVSVGHVIIGTKYRVM